MNRIGKRIFVFLTAVLLLMSLVSLPVLAADTADVERIYGENRCLTAIEVSQFAYPDGADTVIIVTANNFPDALAGSVLAHHLGAPILLVRDNDSDMTAVLAEMERLGVETAYILGGDKAVSDALEAKIETKASVERLAGESRYETAQLIADMVGMPEDGHVFLVSGTNFPDALAIAPVAARRGIPILLTDPDYLRDDVLTAFDELDVKSVTIIGGPKAIPEELAALLEEKGLEIEERIYGDSREDTAVAIAIAFFTEPGSVIVANGREGYPDALVGGYLGALLNAPLLLVKKDEVKDSTTTYLEDNNIGDVKVLGGDKVISDEVEEALGEIEGGEETGGGGVVPGPSAKSASWNLSGGVGTHTIDGTAYVFQGYELLDEDDQRIDLVANNISKMTVLGPGSTTATELTVGDDSDPLLWFNVRKPAGAYKYTVKTSAGDIYEATLMWAGLTSIGAQKQGEDLVLCGDDVYRYHYMINVAMEISDTLVYRIKPTGEIDKQTINNDSDDFSIYFRPTDDDFAQLEGDHTYLIKKGEVWYESVIHYEDKVRNTTKNLGFNSIQKAISEASDDDIIDIRAYTFDEPLTVNKSLTLQGVNVDIDGRSGEFDENGTILTGGITITGGDVTIKGLVINTKGVLASNYSKLTIENNRIQGITEAMVGSPAGSYIGLDVKSHGAGKTNGSVTIRQNVFENIGKENDTGTAIRMVKVDGSITITDNVIKDVTKNGINLYSNCLSGSGANLTITGNVIENWDSDKDKEDDSLKQGGRAIRIDFVGANESAKADIKENAFVPPIYEIGETPVDPDFVKLTSVGIVVDLTHNYWGNEDPTFETILSVDGSKKDECAFSPYYTDKNMTASSENAGEGE